MPLASVAMPMYTRIYAERLLLYHCLRFNHGSLAQWK